MAAGPPPTDDEVVQLALNLAGLQLSLRVCGRGGTRAGPTSGKAPAERHDGAPPQPPTPAADHLNSESSASDWASREAEAGRAGRRAREILDGIWPPSEAPTRVHLRPRVYAILRTADNTCYSPPLLVHSWREARVHVERNGRLADEAVFHGWASQREARAYALAAGCGWER